MNIKEYIESGIIESYVMGLANEPEKAEFERLCLQYPELVAARRAIEDRLETYASENAEAPPPGVRTRVLESLDMKATEMPKTADQDQSEIPRDPNTGKDAVTGQDHPLSIGNLFYSYRKKSPMLSFFRKYLSALYAPVTWTVLIIIAMCIPGIYIPKEEHFFVPDFDKLVHIGLFGGMVFLWCLHLSTRSITLKKLLLGFFLFYLLSNGLGIAMEYVQKYWIPGRDYDLGDIIADMIGAGLGYGISNLWLLPGRMAGRD